MEGRFPLAPIRILAGTPEVLYSDEENGELLWTLLSQLGDTSSSLKRKEKE
jgi:hypothetical protein